MKAFIAAAVMAAVFAASADMGASGDTPKLLFFRSVVVEE